MQCLNQKCAPIAPPPNPDAGAALPTGSPCIDNTSCQPPTSAFCLNETYAQLQTGYLGGYCTQPCGAAGACPAGQICTTDNLVFVSLTTCKVPCPSPGGGQSTCRSGYVCLKSSTGAGYCGPRCDNSSLMCPGTCNVLTGYCP